MASPTRPCDRIAAWEDTRRLDADSTTPLGRLDDVASRGGRFRAHGYDVAEARARGARRTGVLPHDRARGPPATRAAVAYARAWRARGRRGALRGLRSGRRLAGMRALARAAQRLSERPRGLDRTRPAGMVRELQQNDSRAQRESAAAHEPEHSSAL